MVRSRAIVKMPREKMRRQKRLASRLSIADQFLITFENRAAVNAKIPGSGPTDKPSVQVAPKRYPPIEPIK